MVFISHQKLNSLRERHDPQTENEEWLSIVVMFYFSRLFFSRGISKIEVASRRRLHFMWISKPGLKAYNLDVCIEGKGSLDETIESNLRKSS